MGLATNNTLLVGETITSKAITFAMSPYTITHDDMINLNLLEVDTTNGSVIINLPDRVTNDGLHIEIRHGIQSGSNTITINRSGADTITSDLLTSIVLPVAGNSIKIFASAITGNWELLSQSSSGLLGEILIWDKSFPSTPTLASTFVEGDGAVINDTASVFNGYRSRNLNGADVVLTLTWTADGAGAYCTVPATDITALAIGDDVTGTGIAANTYISNIVGTTVTITDVSATGSKSTTFTNDGVFLRGGSSSGVGQKDQMQRITGSADSIHPATSSYEGAIELTNPTLRAWFGNDGRTMDYDLEFDSANSPGARTSSTTYGETRPINRSIVYIMRIK